MDKDAYITELEMRIANLEKVEEARREEAARYERDEKYRLSMLGHDNNRWDFSDNMYLLPSEGYKNDIRLQQVGLNQWLWFDRWGLNPDYIKRFPNKITNSGFEWHDPVTKKPLFWDTDGIVTDASNWEGTYALELAPGQTAKQSTLAEIDLGHTKAGADPEWWENYPTRVSFKHKGGRVKAWVERYDTGERLYIYDNSQEGNINSFGHDVGVIREGYELEYGPIANWAVHWENDVEGVYIDRQEDNMKYVTFGYASFWFMPVKNMGRVRVCFQNAEAPAGDYGLTPYWAETAIPDEWKLPTYRPWKIVQGHDVASAEYTQQRISNWVPTEEGRMVCAWVQDVGGTNRIVWCYTSDEENFLKNNYPGEEIVVDESINASYAAGADVTLFQFNEAGVDKIGLLLRGRRNVPTPIEGWYLSFIDMYVSPSGNGYETVGGVKVSDLEFKSTLFGPNKDTGAPALTGGGNYYGGRERWNYGIVNIPHVTETGRWIVSAPGSSTSLAIHGLTSRGGFYLFISDDQGQTWSLVFGQASLIDAHRTSLSAPVNVKGQIYIGYQFGVRQGLLTSTTGSTWTNRGLMPARAYSAVNNSFGDSFYYDEDEDVLYSATPGALSGSYIWTLEDPTVARMLEVAASPQPLPGSSAVNYSIWEPLMYIYSNNNTSCHFYKTPQGRLAVQWSTGSAWSETWGTTSGPMTVIIGFTMPTGNVWLDAVQIEPDFTFKHPSFYTKGPRSLSPVEIIGMPGAGIPGTDPVTGEPILLPNKHADTHCVGGDDHVSPDCIGALSKADFLAMMATAGYRNTYFNSNQWVVEHYLDCEPVIAIWKGPIGDAGFGTQPFGTSPFGGGVDVSVLEWATHEPTIEVLDKNSFVVTWAGAESGVVVCVSPELAAGATQTITAAWADITGKPSTFTPALHAASHAPAAADTLDSYYAAIGHNHDAAYATLGHNHDLDYADIVHNHDTDYLNRANIGVYAPTADYHPATKKYVDDNAGGASDFTGLTDTPAAYVGHGGKVVAVTAAVDGLEFIDAPGGASSFTDLDDTPAAYAGDVGKVPAVNATEDGLVFVAIDTPLHAIDHRPAAGGDPLGCTNPSELAGVQISAEGVSDYLARADHQHEIRHSIADDHLVTIDDAAAAANEYAQFTANGLRGRTPADVKGDLSVAESFLDLNDTPATYLAQAGKVATVNAGEDAIVFADCPAAANGLPAGGTAGQMLAKIDAVDYNAQWVAAPSGGGVAEGLVKKLVALGM